MKTILFIIANSIFLLNLSAQCNPKVEVKIPDGFFLIKEINIDIPNEQDCEQIYSFVLSRNTEHRLLIVEEDEFKNKASYQFFENDSLLVTNNEPSTGKFASDFIVFCNKTSVYQLKIRKISSGKYCSKCLLLAKQDQGNTSPVKLTEVQKDHEKEVFIIVEKMPIFKDGKGDKFFREWIEQNIKYPEEARKKGIQGRVFIRFVVNYEGYVCDVELARGIDPILDNAALELIKSSPKWERPGTQRGIPVNVRFTFPVNFSIP